VARVVHVSANAANGRVVEECDHSSDPALAEADVVVEEGDEVTAGHREAGIASPGSAESVGEIGDLDVHPIPEPFSQPLTGSGRMCLQHEHHLERQGGVLSGQVFETKLEGLRPPV
jgi:hypothetical protein